MDKPFPPVSLELLNVLRTLYPDRVPNINDTDRQVWYKAGQVQVIRFLEEKFKEQNENILTSKVIE